jgi:excisionase family DNA binding protein
MTVGWRKKELLRPDEVAEILRVHRATVYRMANDGRLEAVKLSPTALRITVASVRLILASPEPDEACWGREG